MAPDMVYGCIHWTKTGHLDVVQVPPYRIRSRRQGPGPRFLFFDPFELQLLYCMERGTCCVRCGCSAQQCPCQCNGGQSGSLFDDQAGLLQQMPALASIILLEHRGSTSIEQRHGALKQEAANEAKPVRPEADAKAVCPDGGWLFVPLPRRHNLTPPLRAGRARPRPL